jgi:hypothetical protein
MQRLHNLLGTLIQDGERELLDAMNFITVHGRIL